jgi:prepilin-type processing-associated H-X9-DG protein
MGGQNTPPASNYAGVQHDVEAPIDVDNHGVFFLNSKLRYDDITDGPSHTLFIGEKLCDPNDLGWMSGTRATLRNTGTLLNTPLPAIVTGVATTPGASPSAENPTADQPQRAGEAPAEPEHASASSGAPAAPSNPAVPADPTLYVGGFASYHPAGVNFAFGDGSARFLADTIDLQILQQLANRADGKLLPAAY